VGIHRPLVRFQLVGFLLPGALAAFGWIDLPLPSIALIAMGQLGPSLAAFILTWRSEGKRGAWQLLKRAFNFEIGWRWLVTAFLLPPALAAGAMGLNVVCGGRLPELTLMTQPLTIPLWFVFILLLQGPVPEEFGWRGYLLDRLQARSDKLRPPNALTSSLIVGILWAVWHLPAWFMQDSYQSFLPFWAFLICTTAFSVLMTWFHNNTGGNLLVALIVYTMINLSILLFPPVEQTPGGSVQGYLILTTLYALVAAIIAIRWGAQRLRRAGATQTAQP
jgi:membrane protease YdiL (CAAX protease family)